MRGDVRAVGEGDDAPVAVRRDARALRGREQLDAEPDGLVARAARQLAAGQPLREPEVVLDPAALPGLPAGRRGLHQQGAQPLAAGVHRGPEAGRAGAHDDDVVEGAARRGRQPDPLGELAQRRVAQHLAVRQQHHGQRGGVALEAGRGEQPAGLLEPHVEVAVGHLVAREELLGHLRLGRPLVAHQGHPGEGGTGAGVPRAEQLLQRRVEPLLGRVPGLEQVVVEVHVVDRADRGVGVGVRRQQHALGVGHQVHGLLEEVHPGHAGHPVVGEQQGDDLAAQRHLAQRLERRRTGLRAQHAVLLAEAAPQVASDRPADRRVVVDREQDGACGHGLACRTSST